jgi:ribokinase
VTRPTVLVVGSLHHDIIVEADHLPRKDETAVGSRWFPKFGGKGGNQAVAAARAGVVCRMFGAVGDDGFGRFLRTALQAGGVDDTFVATVPDADSGISVAILDADGDYAATIVSGANLLIDAGGLADEGLWQGVSVLNLQNEISEAVNLAAARQARSRGVRTILNAAPARTLPDHLLPLIDLLVVNAVEAEMMGAGAVTDLTSATAAARFLGERFASVIVTSGGQGLAGFERDATEFSLPAERVKAVSSHGAGDVFTGTLGAALASGIALPEAAHQASHAAALHVSAAG